MASSELRIRTNPASKDGPHDVAGVPENQTALIMRIDGRWKLLRTVGDVSGGWKGSFDAPEDALAALAAELESESAR